MALFIPLQIQLNRQHQQSDGTHRLLPWHSSLRSVLLSHWWSRTGHIHSSWGGGLRLLQVSAYEFEQTVVSPPPRHGRDPELHSQAWYYPCFTKALVFSSAILPKHPRADTCNLKAPCCTHYLSNSNSRLARLSSFAAALTKTALIVRRPTAVLSP